VEIVSASAKGTARCWPLIGGHTGLAWTRPRAYSLSRIC